MYRHTNDDKVISRACKVMEEILDRLETDKHLTQNDVDIIKLISLARGGDTEIVEDYVLTLTTEANVIKRFYKKKVKSSQQSASSQTNSQPPQTKSQQTKSQQTNYSFSFYDFFKKMLGSVESTSDCNATNACDSTKCVMKGGDTGNRKNDRNPFESLIKKKIQKGGSFKNEKEIKLFVKESYANSKTLEKRVLNYVEQNKIRLG